MDIQQLRYFLVISQNLNYRKAADQLFISRQALSKAIHELEKELGEPLFSTNNNKLQLTPFGIHLLSHASPIIDSFNELKLSIRDWRREKKGHIQAGIGLGTLNALSPQIFADFQKDYPHIFLSIEEWSDLGVRERVETGEVNIGILSCSSESIEKFHSRLIQKGQVYLQVSKDNALAAKDYIEIADLQDQPFISLGKECDMHNLFVKECLEEGFAPKFVMITLDSNTANNMVLLNQGISFGHIQTLNMAANTSLRLIPLHLRSTTWGIYAISKKGIEYTPATQILIDYIVQ